MPVPPVLVELKANASEFMAKMDEAKAKVSHFSDEGASNVSKFSALAGGMYAAAAGAAVTFGVMAVKAGMEQEAANARLSASLTAVGSAMTATSKPVEEAEASMRKLGFADGDTTDSLNKLVQATKDPAKALQDEAIAADIARARHIDLSTATDILMKVETGHVALLGRLGINVKDATGATISQEEAIKRLSELYGGQASAYSKTFQGKLDSLKVEMGHLTDEVGLSLIPKIENLVTVLTHAADWTEKYKTQIKMFTDALNPLNTILGPFKDKFYGLIGVHKDGAKAAGDAGDAEKGLGGALDDAGASAKAAKPNLGDYAEAVKALRDGLLDAKDRATAFKTVLDELIGRPLSAEQATIRYADSVQALGDAFVKNGVNLNLDTGGGRANRSALESAVTAAQDQLSAMQKAGSSPGDMQAVFNQQRSSLLNTLHSYGYSSTDANNILAQEGFAPSDFASLLAQAYPVYSAGQAGNAATSGALAAYNRAFAGGQLGKLPLPGSAIATAMGPSALAAAAGGDIILQVDGQTLGRVTQTALLKYGRNNVSIITNGLG